MYHPLQWYTQLDSKLKADRLHLTVSTHKQTPWTDIKVIGQTVQL